MKTLLLLRHAKSSWDDPALGDVDRPLTGRGRKAAERMGRLLVERRLVPDLIVCSAARRARETFDRLLPAFDHVPANRIEPRLYMAEPQLLLELARDLPDEADTALFIGHNPGFARFAGRLAGSASGDSLQRMAAKFPTAALAVLRFDGATWRGLAPRAGLLEDFVAPRDVE